MASQESEGVSRSRQRQLSQRRIGISLGLVIVALAVATTLVAVFLDGPLEDAPIARELSPEQTATSTRRISVAFDNIQSVWRRQFSEKLDREYSPPKAAFYTGLTVSPCSEGGEVTGPFYCPDSVEAVFDLAFFEALNARLRRNGDLGTALVVAMISASHVQDELGLLEISDAAERDGRLDEGEAAESLATQADCLAGVWAALAADSVGPVPPGFYEQLIRVSRGVMADLSAFAPDMPARLDPFAAAERSVREADFAAGYAAADPAACLPDAMVAEAN